MGKKTPTIDELLGEAEESNIDYSIFGDEIKLKEMNDKHAFINSYNSRPMVMCHVYNDAFNKEILEFRTPEAIEKQYSNQAIEIPSDKGSKYIKLGKWWVEHPKRREYETLFFDPSRPKEHNKCYNLWEGNSCEPRKGSWRHTRKHIWKILCNKDKIKFKYVIKWFAWLIQNPHERAEVAIIFKGKQGAGKGFVMTQFVEMFGRHGMQISNRDHLTGKFSGHLKLVVFLFADEAYYPGDRDVEGTLNMLITENKVTREAKFAHPVLDKNRLHIAMATNNEWVIPAGSDSRRYFINEVDNSYAKNQTTDMKRKEYFGKLWGEMSSGGQEAMLYDMLNINLEGWHPRDDVPETEEIKKQRLMNMPKVHKYLLSFLEDGVFPGQYDNATRYVINGQEFMDYLIKIEPDSKKISLKSMTNLLKEIGVEKIKTAQRNMWHFPDLAKIRKNWDEKFPIGKWDEAIEWELEKSNY